MTDTPTTDTTVEQSVLEILAGALDVSVDVLRDEPVLARHEWDSISSLDALAQLENRLDVTLDLRAFHAARTVEDVVALVRPTS
ncbi:acyl carrier protein [Saccharothrix luteola]|uniref:acyl carrier protein n=1 Tax=Saccharothrix luteola TaxID=2893018 RepID=UPI001E4E822B|nr:acyl carrier protein [Saccharothrix luteola]MCC8250179.1 acyl carrier protein [Saccharothrix luteola]